MIVSTTLVGQDCSHIVGDAIASAHGLVDAHLIVDTAGDGRSIDAAMEAAGDGGVLAAFPWVDDYAAARNFCLDEATRRGARWAVTLDPDERLNVDPRRVRDALATTAAGCLLLSNSDGRYAKERFFRLPCPERFEGIVHEAFASFRVGVEVLEGGSFSELPKSSVDQAAKGRREVAMLQRQVAASPDDPRWRYYLGDALERTGDLPAAIAAYLACVDLRGWPEEAAWACYRAAQCEITRERYGVAVELCATGLGRQAGTPELAWTAALAEWRAGRSGEAVAWARMAEALGDVRGCRASATRIGFRYPPAAFEGPYDILRFALRDLGDHEGARRAERDFNEAWSLRQAAP